MEPLSGENICSLCQDRLEENCNRCLYRIEVQVGILLGRIPIRDEAFVIDGSPEGSVNLFGHFYAPENLYEVAQEPDLQSGVGTWEPNRGLVVEDLRVHFWIVTELLAEVRSACLQRSLGSAPRCHSDASTAATASAIAVDP